ncbi:related to Putative mitochondrial carrier protein PET8 [Hanseniaspora guilliermondii]|uniref:Putative mitochondrial carrier protein PET8 n=1 Tax=Hanseniaspora guilliermondii TaxID=56406 RepID=A0A1L0AVB6_9ASCO|nr:related to Putative mitochondrial carrier protein PET8 [Hanseniaspora guilliermondii]
MSELNFLYSLIAGGIAGTSTDVFFYPIDTIKTRLQSKEGFFKSGGYKNVYSGISACIIASAPSASLFFVTYDYFKHTLKLKYNKNISDHQIHMLSASLGEIAACSVRVPAEVIKQRTQANIGSTPITTLKAIVKESKGSILLLKNNLYKGFGMTITREIPFTCIQFPLYEYMKLKWRLYSKEDGQSLEPWKGAICGSLAGATAAAITTPLDVIKTRLMLSKLSQKATIVDIIKELHREQKYGKSFFKGIGPRTLWIGVGGAVFLGMYESVIAVLNKDTKKILG